MPAILKNTSLGSCPSCQTPVNAASATCANCGWRFSASSAPGAEGRPVSRAFVPAGRPKIPVVVQAGFQIDRTGSTASFRIGIRRSVDVITTGIEKRASRLEAWVGTHGDLDYGEQWGLLSDRKSGDQVRHDVAGITYGGGGDAPESHLDGFHSLLEAVPWDCSFGVSRCLVGFVTDDSKPARCGLTAESLGALFKKKDVDLYLVCEPTPTLDALVNAAGGLRFTISNDPSISELQQVAANVAASIVARTLAGGTKPLRSVIP